MNGLNKLKNNKKTIDNKSIIKICDSDDDKSVESDKKCSDKNDGKSDGDKSDNIVKKKTRPTKADLFKNERNITLNKLNNILGVTDENKTFYIYDIDENNDKQKLILGLYDDVSKFFKGKSTALFTRDDSEKRWLSIIKIIYKEMDFELKYGTFNITRNGNNIKSGFYVISNSCEIETNNTPLKNIINDKDNDNKLNNSIKKNIGGRPTKEEIYKKERLDTLNKLNNILGITDKIKTFYIYDIDELKEKNINELLDNIKKFFRGKSSALFAKEKIDRKWLCIVKIIYKEMKYKMIYGSTYIIRNDKKIKSSYYTLDNPTTL